MRRSFWNNRHSPAQTRAQKGGRVTVTKENYVEAKERFSRAMDGYAFAIKQSIADDLGNNPSDDRTPLRRAKEALADDRTKVAAKAILDETANLIACDLKVGRAQAEYDALS